MGSFTNIAYSPSQFATNASGSGASLSYPENISLYQGGLLDIYSTSTGSECYCNVTSGSGFLRTNLISGHTYYACMWAKCSSGTKSVDLFIGKSIDSESDHIIPTTSVGTSWTRCSGILVPSDVGSGANKARIDFNHTGTRYIHMYYSGFLVVDLTNSSISSKSKAWCDDHLYWVPSGSSGSFTDYDNEGTKTRSSDTGNPSVANLKTYANYAAQKANRGGTTVSNPPSTASASWINTVNSALNSNKSKGTNYGSCGVNKIQPANWGTITTPSGANFQTTGRTTVNTLIRNADALYAQQYCIQATLKYPSCSCNSDYCNDCCDNDCCDSDCSCNPDCSCDPDCWCYADCSCNGDWCEDCHYCNNSDCSCNPDCSCNSDVWCCNGQCGNCNCDNYGYCSTNSCSCNSVCSCNWV